MGRGTQVTVCHLLVVGPSYLGVAELIFASVNEKIIFLQHPTVLGSHETPIRTVYKKNHLAAQETSCELFPL